MPSYLLKALISNCPLVRSLLHDPLPLYENSFSISFVRISSILKEKEQYYLARREIANLCNRHSVYGVQHTEVESQRVLGVYIDRYIAKPFTPWTTEITPKNSASLATARKYIYLPNIDNNASINQLLSCCGSI